MVIVQSTYTMDVKCQERWASANAQASFSVDLKAAMVQELHVCRGMVIHMVKCFERPPFELGRH